jgi:hypothetical protein
MRTWNSSIVFRLLAVLAGGVMTVIGLVAVAEVSWGGNGFDAPPVDVAGMTFTPTVAVVTAAAGIIALIAGALYDRASKLVVGGLLIVGGVVILLTDTVSNPDWAFEDGQGWLAIGVGATLIVAAALMQMVWTASERRPERRVVDERVHHDRAVTS